MGQRREGASGTSIGERALRADKGRDGRRVDALKEGGAWRTYPNRKQRASRRSRSVIRL